VVVRAPGDDSERQRVVKSGKRYLAVNMPSTRGDRGFATAPHRKQPDALGLQSVHEPRTGGDADDRDEDVQGPTEFMNQTVGRWDCAPKEGPHRAGAIHR